MERHDFQESGPKLLSGQGIGVVQPRPIGSPSLGDGPDGKIIFVAQPEQFHALDCLGTALFRPRLLQLGRLSHDRLRPVSFEEAGLTGVIRRDFWQCSRSAHGPALEAPSDVADDAKKEGAKAGYSAGPRDLHRAALAKTLNKDFLNGVV